MAAPEHAVVEKVAARPERLVLFTPQGPLVVHLEITIEGQPQRLAAEQVLDDAMQAAGADVAGIVTWARLVAGPRFSAGQFGNMPTGTPSARQRITQQFDFNHDGRVQRDELAACLAQDSSGGLVFAVRSLNDDRGERQRVSPLFALFDEDEDGRLSLAEMAAAPLRLRSLDVDADDTVVSADFRAMRSGDPPMRRRRLLGIGQAIELQRWTTESIFYTLCELYGAENRLDARSFLLTPGLLAELDADRNNTVDQEEIARLVDARADLLLIVNFTPAATDDRQPIIKLQKLSDDLLASGARQHLETGRITLNLPNWELDLAAADLTAGADPLAIAKAQFAMLDVDKNDVLEGDELTALDAAAGMSLKDLDDNGDGSLSLDELKKSFDKSRSFRSVQVQARVGAMEDALFSQLLNPRPLAV